MLHVLDRALRDIARHVAAHPPERGGALLGPIGTPFVSAFVIDEEAQTTAATYRPSRSLAHRVQAIERTENLEFKGILHSHPGGFDRPSRQDEYELGVGLSINPHMAFYLAPIVTHTVPAALGRHELAIESAKVSFYAGYRAGNGETRVKAVSVREVPLQRDLETLGRAFRAPRPPEVFLTEFGTIQMLGGKVDLDGGLELLFIASELYPALPPMLLVTPRGGDTEQVQLPWDLQVAPEGRLLAATRAVILPPGPYHKAYGIVGGPALTLDPERARLAGWSPRFTGQDVAVESERIWAGLFARASDRLSEALADKRVLIAGLGSVGSFFTEQLARSGVGAFTLIDHDVVELANLSRTVYDIEDVGKRKADALARHILGISPGATIRLEPVNVLDVPPAVLHEAVASADLVIAATDEPRAQLALNRFAYALGKPALFLGMYAGAQGGEVIVSVPELTACYLCATSTRHVMEQDVGRVMSDVDYGTGRLPGEIALGADIHHVTTAGIKLGLSLLLPADSDARLKDFGRHVLQDGATYLTASTVPNYWFYPQLFGNTPGQGAYQSVWLTPTRDEACPVCGERAGRIGPFEVPLRVPRVVILDAPSQSQ